MQRLAWPDYAKALGMFLVVYGHSLSTDWGIGRWIYSFHIPLFFLVSGALLTRRRLESPWRAFLADTARALLPAYFTFAAVGFLAWLLVLRRFGVDAGGAVSPWYRFAAVLYGTGKPSGFRLEPTALWFFPCLFSARLLVYWIHRLARGSPGWVLAGTAGLASVGVVLPPRVALPFELDAALVAQSFIVIGVELERHRVLERLGTRARELTPTLLAGGACCAFFNAPVDMRAGRYGNAALYYAAALATSLGVLLFFSRRAPSRLATRIAENTIIVFPLHVLVFSLFAAFYVFVLRVPLAVRENALVGLIASIANLALLVWLAPLLRRTVPWVYGPGASSGVQSAAPRPHGALPALAETRR